MSDNVRRIIPSLSMFLFYPFHSFSRFLPIQRGRFGPKKVVSFSICFARQVAVVARARKRWSWSCQRIRSRESSAFLLLFGWPGISRAWIILGSLTTFLCSSLDSWHSSSNQWLPGQDYRTNCSQTMRMPTVSQWARTSEGWTAVQDMFTYVIVRWSFIKCWLLLWITGFC